jgi:hypothetical protein
MTHPNINSNTDYQRLDCLSRGVSVFAGCRKTPGMSGSAVSRQQSAFHARI